jgi:hypothetical protein
MKHTYARRDRRPKNSCAVLQWLFCCLLPFHFSLFFFIPHHILVSYDVPNNAYPKRPLHGGIFLECAIKGGAWGNDAVDTDCMPLDICKL